MKKLITLLLILLLVGFCVPAFAASTDGQGDTVTRNAELAAFLDGEGRIYISGLERPVNSTPARSLVSIDPYRILFFAQENAEQGIPQGRLISLTLDGFNEATVTDDAYAACLDGDSVYYISSSEQTQLVRYDLDSKSGSTVFTATESLGGVYTTSIGVIASLVDGAGSYINDPITGDFITYAGDAAVDISYGKGYEAYLTETDNLFVRQDGALTPALVDTNVRDWALVDRSIYYISGVDGSLALKQYQIDSNIWNFILTLPQDTLPQLTASENALFTISSNHVIYSVDTAGKRLVNYATLPSPQSYALGGTQQLSGYRIEAVSGQLNLYGEVEDTTAVPTFTFVDFTPSTLEAPKSGDMLLSAYDIDAESTVWDLLQPAAQYSPLRRGSRGDAVSAIQQPLLDKGYYDYRIDGIFGWRTERAVQLLQDALGVTVTGVADETLQRAILTGSIPAYDPYKQLNFGDTGLRVTEMQQRLRDLGYLADDADGIFGVRTQEAVKLFQDENGLTVSGTADSDTLRALYSSSARVCSSYIDLRRGDSGYRVRELNRRLKELYYLEGGVGSNYTYATEEAVRRFQRQVGMRVTGQATPAVQRALFSPNAPEYCGFITLQRGDHNDRVYRMQVRLRDLGYYHGALDGYFGQQTYYAVRAFQRQAGLPVTGIADPVTLRRLFAPDAPYYRPPLVMTTPIIDLIGVYPVDAYGVYLIPADEQALHFYWTAEGVEDYDVRLSDPSGHVLTSAEHLHTESLVLSTTNMRQNVTYRFTVVAHPKDRYNNRDASASLRFRIVPKPATLNSVTININGDYTYMDGENVYEIARDALKFSWYADGGEVGRYAYTITDNATGARVASGGGQNITYLDATTLTLEADKLYTLTVMAYPKNNDAGMVSSSLKFRVVDKLAPEEPIELPSTLEALTYYADPNDLKDPTQTDQTVGVLTIKGCGGKFHYVLSSEYSTKVYAEGDGRCDANQSAEIKWNGIDIDGNPFVDDMSSDSLLLKVWITYDDEKYNSDGDDPQHKVNVPLQHSSNPSEDDQDDDGETKAKFASLGFTWDADDTSYRTIATITTPLAATVDWGVTSGDGADAASDDWLILTSGLRCEPEQSFEMQWNGLDDDGAHPDGTATLTLKVWVRYGDGTPDETFSGTFTVDYGTASSANTAPEEDEPITTTPDLSITPIIGTENLDVTTAQGTSTEEVALVGEGMLEMSWSAEGEVASYDVRITDAAGSAMVDQESTESAASISADDLEPDQAYALSVVAHYASGDDTSSTLYFMRQLEEQPEGEETAPEDEAEPTDDPNGEATPTDDPNGEATPTDDPNGEPAPTEGTGDAANAPALAISPSYDAIGAEVATPEGGTSNETVYLVSQGLLTLSWPAEGDVASYQVNIANETGVPIVNQELTVASGQISTDNLTPDSIYALTVTASFTDGTTASSTLYFKYPVGETDEDVPTETSLEDTPVEGEETTSEGTETSDGEASTDEAPAAISEPALSISPSIGSTSAQVMTPDGYTSTESVQLVGQGSLSLSWPTEGEVSSYNVRITDDAGNRMVDQTLSDTSAQLSTDNLAPNRAYTMTVTAYFASGESSSSTLYFMYQASESAVDESAETEVQSSDEPDYGESSDDDSTDGDSMGDDYEQSSSDGPAVMGDPMVSISPSIGSTSAQVITPDGYTSTESVQLVGQGSLSLSWPAEGEVSSYNVRITDDAGNRMVDQTLSDTSAQLSTDNLTPNRAYAMTVTAYFASGESSSSTLYFMYQASESAVDESANTEVQSSDEPDYNEESSDDDSTYGDSGYEETSNDEPAYVDYNWDDYEQPSSDEPAVMGDPMVSVSPSIGSTSAQVMTPDGYTSTESVQLVGQGSLSLSWPAEGDVTGYSVRITDDAGNAMVDQSMSDTSAQLSTNNLTPNRAYTMTVTAYFSSGDSTRSTLYFMYQAEEESNYEEPSYDEPVYDEPTYDEPTYDEPVYSEPSYDVPSYDEPVYDEPSYEEPSYDEPVYDEPSYEDSYYEDSYYEEPSYEDSYYEEDSYEDSYYEDDYSYDDGGSTSSYPTNDPSAWNFDVNAYSDSAAIATIQQRLSAWGWLGGYSSGSLDSATIQAVIDLQNYLNANGHSVAVTDPNNPVIGRDTLQLMFNASGESFYR